MSFTALRRHCPLFLSPPTSPGKFALSIADTIAADQREKEANLRKIRSDLGSTRGPYMTMKKAAEEVKKQIEESYPKEQAKQLLKVLKKSKVYIVKNEVLVDSKTVMWELKVRK